MSTGSQGEGPRYYPSGPSTGQYPQYPQNPYPQGASPAGAPYGGAAQSGQFAYSPYSQDPAPAAEEPREVRRPATMIGALVLLVLSAVPFLVFGVLGLFVPISQDMFPPELGLDAMLTQYNVSFDQFLQAVRLLLALVAVLALVYIGMAVAAFAGKAWGRVAATALTVLFCGFLLLNLGGGGSSLIVLAPVVLAVAGVVLMFLRPSADWFAARR